MPEERGGEEACSTGVEGATSCCYLQNYRGYRCYRRDYIRYSEDIMTYFDRVKKDIVYQTDPRLPENVQRYGCRVFSLLAIAQFVSGNALSAEQIQIIVNKARVMPQVIMNDKMFCGSKEHKLINMAFLALDNRREGRQVGWTEEHLYTVDWEYMIARWRTDGPDGHFTLFDRAQIEIYDPWNPEQAGYEINRRGIEQRLLYRTWEV